MKKTLWNKNFTLMFIGNIISSLGGVGLGVAMGVIIFDQTGSTVLSGLFVSITMIPHLILPLLVGSIVDKNDPLKLLLRNETVLLGMFTIIFLFTYQFGFSYIFYLIFFFMTATLSVISDISGQSVTAQLMPADLMSKGYAIMSTIYPLASVIVTPIALVLYKAYGIELLLMIYIILSLIDILLERKIDHEFKFDTRKSTSIKDTFSDMKEGILYIKDFTPIRTVFIFFTFVIIANGASSLTYPYFARSAHLSLENYALVMTVNSMGYMFGGFFHYFVDIPKKRRYLIAVVIYFMFIIFESLFLFMPLIVMLGMKFLLGLGGMNSANIRNSAVQATVKDEYRGKVNGVFGMLMGLASILGNLIFGALGEVMAIPYIMILAQLIYLTVVIVFVFPKKYEIKSLYNLELTSEAQEV